MVTWRLLFGRLCGVVRIFGVGILLLTVIRCLWWSRCVLLCRLRLSVLVLIV